ncbi:hypothetical protein M8C21_004743 [Ambrosia artemisiifolia]|uniref:Uncharacterized protein n=1 Tax=Ambrosia artemisiifolia TaxID=4212 RepID=A0AAD5C628_AMBAR|nr:hypothetical protein M8C21_004743 [Ambrosia artemisiifolia]
MKLCFYKIFILSYTRLITPLSPFIISDFRLNLLESLAVKLEEDNETLLKIKVYIVHKHISCWVRAIDNFGGGYAAGLQCLLCLLSLHYRGDISFVEPGDPPQNFSTMRGCELFTLQDVIVNIVGSCRKIIIKEIMQLQAYDAVVTYTGSIDSSDLFSCDRYIKTLYYVH